MLNNSFQSIHDVFLYRVEHDKKNLTVNLLYEFVRTIDEKISKNFIVVVIKKMTTIIIKLQKKLKKCVHRQDQTTEKLTALQTLHQCERYDYVNFTRYCCNPNPNPNPNPRRRLRLQHLDEVKAFEKDF
jgi:hypothetical protein